MPDPKIKTIAGQEFPISQPYSEGHVCTAAEAKTLNQTRSENIGNNMRSTVLDALAAAEKGDNSKLDALPAAIAKYDAEYTFTLANVGAARKLDPEEREAMAIAKEALRAHLAKTGRKMNVTPEGETDDSWAEKVQTNLESIAARDEVKKEAKKRVTAKKKATDALGEGLSI